MEKINIQALKISPESPIINNPEQIEIYKKLILETDRTTPIIVNENNEIILGEAKYLALKELGKEIVEVQRMEKLSLEQVRLLRIVETRAIQLGEWDDEKLLKELEGLGELVNISGFDIDALKETLEKYGDSIDEIEEISIPEVEEVFFSRKADLYILGEHKLLCGDSTNQEDVKRLLGDEKIDLLLTDPPYNVNYEASNGLKIQNDKLSSEKFYEFLVEFYKNSFNFMKDGAAFYIFYADMETVSFRRALKESGFKLSQNLIWAKNAFNLSRQDYNWRHEPILYGWKPGATHFFIKDYTQDTVLEENINYKKMSKTELIEHIYSINKHLEESSTVVREEKQIINDVHPTMKPIKLLARLMANSSKKGWIVGDLFGGSGSTLITAEQLQRKARMMEYDPRYVDVIVKRYMRLGKTDIKLIRDGLEINYQEIAEFIGD
ncbi:DNA modification methylase [Cetobacterium sp. 2A]|uniref:DNA modification methylase n=1 Tax=Cetobacterium sp. 2A TaxID=2754723 RepID=UPI00163C9856|nr:DNA modification methylase [Cetobacterium sp. 2A]MBC2855376.1 DNA modification methylase [Cetobacterium sp. 2A]